MAEGVELPKSLIKKYPKEIVFVLEQQYKDLVCDDSAFSVTLWFSGAPGDLYYKCLGGERFLRCLTVGYAIRIRAFGSVNSLIAW
jgi:hypothetical protein